MSNGFLTRLSAILIILVAILLYLWVHAVQKGNAENKQLSNLLAAVTDTLRTTRLSDSSQRVSINSLTVQSTKDLLAIKTKDSSITALQQVVTEYKSKLKDGGAVVIVKGDTKIIDSSKTIVIHDTVAKCDTYIASINKPWYTANIRANCDSTHLNLKVTNYYNVVIGKDKGKWFADVTNKNPYSSIETMRVANVEVPKQKVKRVNLSLFAGYGFNLKGTVQAAPLIGAGVSYTILSLF